MSNFGSLIAVAACSLVAAKIWYDIVNFAYHRERMLVYRELASEGVNLLRIAVEKGALSDLAAASVLPLNGDISSQDVEALRDSTRDVRSRRPRSKRSGE